jgi:uncharacterized membrane protein
MSRRLLPLGIALALVAQLVLRLICSFAALPPRMATHFDLAGKPNGFQTRIAFAYSSVLVCLFIFALFTALPYLLTRAPDRLINLPNKDYWLAPERRAETLARLGTLLDWLGSATLGLLAGVFELIIRANLAQKPLGYQLWVLLIGYHMFMLFWVVSFMRTLQRPDRA